MELRPLHIVGAQLIDGDAPRIGEETIVAAWPLGSDGRKHRGAVAIYTADGDVIARAEALWIEPRAAS